MDDNILVRVYDVGFGDCIYIRVPDEDEFYHILIDCGSSGAAEPTLKEAMANVRSMLPEDEESNRRLDLLVVTHLHADHIKGFDPDWFKGIKIRHIWLSAFMKEDHPQAKQSQALLKLADKAVKSLLARGLHLQSGLDTLLTNSIWNPGAMKALRTTLPEVNDINPLYVCRDVADPTKSRLSTVERDKHQIHFEDGTTCLRDFKEDDTCLRVLAPEWDIDGYYLGKETSDFQSLLGFYGYNVYDLPETISRVGKISIPRPFNISRRDFRLLRQRILYSALAFSQEDSKLKNNTSVVLLLEWRGRRLLFTGDAEWKGKSVKKGRSSGSWDVMLELEQSEAHLSKPLDFLKVGHHGSVNGTPFVDEEDIEQSILDKILPKGGNAQAVTSTLAGKHGEKKEVPYHLLMSELGLRIDNAREYPDEPGLLQPQRTDLQSEPWIDVTVEPGPDWICIG